MSGFRYRPFRTQPRRLSRMVLGRGFVTNAHPTITVPGAQSAVSNVAKAITGTSLADTDGNTQTVTIATNHSGTVSLASLTGLTGSGNGTNNLSYAGTIAALNTALATLTYTSATDYVGSETISIGTDDGAGGTDSDSVAITVTWTPASLSSLVAWFDPSYGVYSDAGSTAAVALDPIYQWNARAGSSAAVLTQATLANRFVLNVGANGKYYWTANGTSTYMAAGNTSDCTLTGDFTIAVLANCTNASSDRYLVSKQKTSANYDGYGFGRIGGKLVVDVSDGTYTSKAGATTVNGSQGWLAQITKRASATATVYFDNTSDGSGAVQGGSTAFAAALNIGRFAGGGQHWDGHGSHIVILSDDISDSDRTLLKAYFDAQEPT